MGVYIPNITEEQYRKAMFDYACKTLHEDGTFTIEPKEGFSFKIPNPIEIKAPHGRLADIDAIKKEWLKQEFYGDHLQELKYLDKAIRTAPMIIEAEDEHEP